MNPTPLQTVALEEGKVILPFKEEQFYDFIKGLLGKPQTIERTYNFSYALTREDVAHLDALISQRIAQQNSSKLITFNAVLYFSDDSKVTFNSLADLNAYTEIKPVVSTGLDLTWIYLVSFQDRTSPERQEIEVRFGTEIPRIRQIEYIDEFTQIRRFNSRDRGDIVLSIRHSARTWATDIENLFNSALQSLAITETSQRQFIRRWQSKFGLWCGIVSGVLPAAIIYLALLHSAEQYRNAFAKLATNANGADTLVAMHKEIGFVSEFLISKETSGWWLKAIIYIVLSIVFSIAIGTTLSSILPPQAGPNILYSRKASELYEQRRLIQTNAWTTFLKAAFGGVAAGVVGNLIFYWMMK